MNRSDLVREEVVFTLYRHVVVSAEQVFRQIDFDWFYSEKRLVEAGEISTAVPISYNYGSL